MLKAAFARLMELERKAAHVALGIRRAWFACDRREPRQHRRLGASAAPWRVSMFGRRVGVEKNAAEFSILKAHKCDRVERLGGE